MNPAAVQAQAKLPPPPNAQQATSIGQVPESVQTANGAGDTDRYWIQEIDIDGNGTVQPSALLWDDEDKILYAYA